MAKFLTTAGITHALEDIISTAEKKISLVSPYWQLSDIFQQRLMDASNRGVKIDYYFKVDKLNQKEINEFKSEIAKRKKRFQNIEIIPVENLHAKCYYNEKMMLITSMNLYDYSIKNNREMGILIDAVEDKQIYQDALKEIQSIKDNALFKIFGDTKPDYGKIKARIAKNNKTIYKKAQNDLNTAYCIRCGDNIKYNPDKPFCLNCYDSWSEWQNPDYEENLCHSCGKQAETSFARPLCYGCYKKYS